MEDKKGDVVRFNPGVTADKMASGEMRVIKTVGDDIDLEKVRIEAKSREIMGDSFVGVEEVERAFGITIPREKVPKIPFDQGTLERALQLGQRLVFRISHTEEDGHQVPITIDWLIKHYDLLDPNVISLNSLDDLFYTSETPDVRWSLVTNWLVPLTSGMNYIDQTREVIRYLQNQVFEYDQIPEEYRDPIEAFRKLDEVGGAFERAGKHNNPDLHRITSLTLANLDITKLTRPKAVDILFDRVVSHEAIQSDSSFSISLESDYTFTSSYSIVGNLVSIGRFDDRGGIISSGSCFHSLHKLGAVFSRYI